MTAPLLSAGPTAAQGPGGILESAVMEVDLAEAEAGGAEVALTYRLRPGAGADRAPLAVIEFGDAALVGVEAVVAGRPAELALGGTGPRLTGWVGLPAERGEVVDVTLRYRVEGAVTGGRRRRVRVPVLAVAWPPAEALPGTFVATAWLPADVTVYESFPASSRAVADDRGEGRTIELQVVPAMVGFRVTTGPGPLMSLRRAVDLALLVAALIALLAGWRYLGRRTRELEAAR